MKTKINIIILFAIVASFAASCQGVTSGQKEPWSQSQLLEPSSLAKTINNPDAKQPIVFCIGPQAVIKGSVDIGPTGNKANLDKLQARLEKLPKDADIVIYCGCCPFSRCPEHQAGLRSSEQNAIQESEAAGSEAKC